MTPRKLDIYIAASWKHQHAVTMLTALLRHRGHSVRSFVENNHGEQKGHEATKDGKPMPFEEWVWSPRGTASFEYDTKGATETDLVIYIGPSGKDAAAEIGAAWAVGTRILGLHAKGEDFGLMRRMIEWHDDYVKLLAVVDSIASPAEGPTPDDARGDEEAEEEQERRHEQPVIGCDCHDCIK